MAASHPISKEIDAKKVNYAPNQHLMWRDDMTPGGYNYRKLTACNKPSQTALLGDATWIGPARQVRDFFTCRKDWPGTWQISNTIGDIDESKTRHGGRPVLGFADRHIERRTVRKFERSNAFTMGARGGIKTCTI